MKAVALVVIAMIALLAVNGRTPLELMVVALLVLIFGGAALVVLKLVEATRKAAGGQ